MQIRADLMHIFLAIYNVVGTVWLYSNQRGLTYCSFDLSPFKGVKK